VVPRLSGANPFPLEHTELPEEQGRSSPSAGRDNPMWMGQLRMRKFTMVWAGYLVTMTGTALTGFALGVWIYLETGSTMQFAVSFILSLLPGILLSPVAGALVDRWNRRTVLLVADAVGIATTLTLALLFTLGVLEPWHIYVTTTIRSALRSLQIPALSSSIVLLAPKEEVGRANGMVLLANAVSQTVAPALGGVFLLGLGLNGVLLIDCATYVVNVTVLLLTRIPRPPASEAGTTGKGTLRGEAGQGWRYLTGRRSLVALVAFYAALDFSVGFVDVLITPLVLAFASSAALGTVLSIGGIGLVLGSVTMTAWGGPRRRVHGVAGFAVPLGLSLCVGALHPSVTLVAIAAFGFMFCSMIIDGTTRSILQLEVEPDLQGRVIALFNMVTNSTLFTGYLLAGPVADHLFEPLLAKDGALAGSVGDVLGVGQGRGMAFLLLLLGGLVLVTAAVGYLQPSLRSLEKPAPTAEPTADEPAAGPALDEPVAGAGLEREATVEAVSDLVTEGDGSAASGRR